MSEEEGEALEEMKSLVESALVSSGVLSKIKAELRASVFLALDGGGSAPPVDKQKLNAFLKTSQGKLAAELVLEFLEFFGLDFTKSVLLPEAELKPGSFRGRNDLAKELDLHQQQEESNSSPLLAQIMDKAATANDLLAGYEPARRKHFGAAVSPEVQYSARLKFQEYDQDKNGMIDKQELRALLGDLFPDMDKHMLDRYVNDEFRAADVDFSSSIDFEEFIGLYKRLIVEKKSAGAHAMRSLLNSSLEPGRPSLGLESSPQSFNSGFNADILNTPEAGDSVTVRANNPRPDSPSKPPTRLSRSPPKSPSSAFSDENLTHKEDSNQPKDNSRFQVPKSTKAQTLTTQGQVDNSTTTKTKSKKDEPKEQEISTKPDSLGLDKKQTSSTKLSSLSDLPPLGKPAALPKPSPDPDPLPWLSGDKIATGIKSTPTFLTEPPPEQSQSPFARLEDIRRRLTKFSNERQASSPPHSFSEKTPQDDYNSYTSFSDASISESISEQLSKLSANDDTADFSILSTQSHREYDYGEPVQK
eukprot:m.104644 g.104644  ORF g.104644 m.104644 type:complete len:530 (+) comp22457_c1_seq2:78-1667(+)